MIVFKVKSGIDQASTRSKKERTQSNLKVKLISELVSKSPYFLMFLSLIIPSGIWIVFLVLKSSIRSPVRRELSSASVAASANFPSLAA